MPPKRWNYTTETPQGRLMALLKHEINNNNLLGMPPEEVDNAVNMISTCSSKSDVFFWCSTLGLGEAIAAEVVKRRDDYGPFFDGAAAAASASASGSAGNSSGGAVLSIPSLKIAAFSGSASNDVKRSKPNKKKKTLAEVVNAGAALKAEKCFCGCHAVQKHEFAASCENCGRIICAQESTEECYFCHLDPRTCVSYEIQVQNGIIDRATQEKNEAGLQQAQKNRDKLLEYARNSAQRTLVIDDQSAGLTVAQKHQWMSMAERQLAEVSEAALRRKERAAERHRVTGTYELHVDLVNKNIALGAIEVPPSEEAAKTTKSQSENPQSAVLPSNTVPVVEAKRGDEDEEGEGGVGSACIALSTGSTRAVPAPFIAEQASGTKLSILYDPDAKRRQVSCEALVLDPAAAALERLETCRDGHMTKHWVPREEKVSCRLQQDYFEDDVEFWKDQQAGLGLAGFPTNGDGELSLAELEKDMRGYELSLKEAMQLPDNGMCISMHQPWAQLLVEGIKMHEGRTWYSDFRGRLWIHATAAEPTNVEAVEAKYAKFLKRGQKMPQHYPRSCLLGYVYVMDCMSHERYTTAFDPGLQQEDSPFKFICGHPVVLPVPLPMDGNHKIYELAKKHHLAAKRQLNEK